MTLFFSVSLSANETWQELEKQLKQELNHDSNTSLIHAQNLLKDPQYSFKNNRDAWFTFNLYLTFSQINLGQFDEAKENAQMLYKQNDAEHFPVQRAESALLIAMIADRQSNVNLSKTMAKEGLQLLGDDKSKHAMLSADLYSLLSGSYRDQADYDQAIAYAKLALEYSKGDKSKLATMHNQIGVLYDYTGNLELALKHHEESLIIRKENDNQQGISDSLYNIGEIYRDMKQYPSALSHFKQALQVDQSLGNPYHIANSHGKLGQVYTSTNELELAKEHIQKGLELTRKMHSNSDTSWQLSNMAHVFMAEGNLEQAKQVSDEALQLALETNAKRTEHTVRMTLLDIAMKQHDVAEAQKQISILLAMKNIGLQYEQELHKTRAQLYEESGDIGAAYQATKDYLHARQRLYEYLEKKQTQRLKQNVEVIRQEQALNLLQKEKELQQFQLDNLKLQRGVALLIMLLVVGVLLMIYFRQMAKQRMASLKAHMLANSLEEKNQLLSDVAHELRTPLTALKLSIELLEHNIEPDIDKAYAKVHGKISQLDNLIRDIYHSAQYDNNVMQLSKESCDLNELIDDVVGDFEGQFKQKHQALLVHKPTSPLMCNVDPERFKQIIINLLNNSLAYTYEHGQTQVSLESITSSNKQSVKLIVSDSEPGLEEPELEKVFDRLYRVESSRTRDLGGSGLGLAICKQIVLAHGGSIYAKQSKLGGVEFTVTFNNL
ncbi:tetratricopeptide repeat protein [Pseudoalteromonas sp. JBTF-M23]|uniref:histidine kinase n=1 Tax=Pseudoalteromonas caenipelagi TaxID=2726988 RepID=A0A849VBD4_9GAMM|nr:tetratricopeptide repeat protein [Pseudoalteromonas caenipelagi]NOU49117.1 tetratricopeptide repeat protein [Pseudoalteromonas caenipelagi]